MPKLQNPGACRRGATYTGRAFSLGGRLGARYQVDHLFVALAAEATAIGPLRIGGTLQVGLGF